MTTDAPVPQLVDRALVDILDDRGELACTECRRQFGVPTDPAAWPISFGVTPPAATGGVRVRVRLYRAARAADDGLPPVQTTLDALALLPAATGNTEVQMTLHAECVGLPSAPATHLACSGPERAFVPERPVELGRPDGASRPGTWPRATTTACAGAPDGMVCVPGGFFILGDARDLRNSGTELNSHRIERFVTLSPFAIDRDEMSVGVVRALVVSGRISQAPRLREPGVAPTFAQCTYLGAAEPANDQLPVNCVAADLAAQTCAALGKRLPTEAEWEWVAGNLAAETRFPWGDGGDPCDLADVGLGRDAFDSTEPEMTTCRVRLGRPTRGAGIPAQVNMGDVSFLGVRRLAGGVSEWVADKLDSYTAACWKPEQPFLADPRCDLSSEDKVTFRGASWLDAPGSVSAVSRQGSKRGVALPSIGFRCAATTGEHAR